MQIFELVIGVLQRIIMLLLRNSCVCYSSVIQLGR